MELVEMKRLNASTTGQSLRPYMILYQRGARRAWAGHVAPREANGWAYRLDEDGGEGDWRPGRYESLEAAMEALVEYPRMLG